ncbi:MAG: hypothetical protein Q9182_004528 [Xanthomendoza sp. 2 TL-2023]
MEDPNLIATLILLDGEKRAENAFCYDKNRKRYLPPTRGIAEGPTISSREATPAREQPDDDDRNQAATPRQLPVYISERELGRGSFGRVDRVIDVSTGAMYARKEFYEPRRVKNEERRRQQREHWLDQVRREIRITRESSHENIVQVVASRDGPLPFLVMPYLSLGNLEDLHSESPITGEETINVLFQALNALRYLHLRGVAHRDQKPENILVESRFPLSVKLADFGLANDKPDLETLCGTQLYIAPEVYSRNRYTVLIDMWSVGVITFQYVYGLPPANSQKHDQHMQLEELGLIWCRRVVDQANDWDSDDLIDLLTSGLLRIEPEERLCADACLARGFDLGLFHGHSHGRGSATPIPQRTLEDENDDDDGSTTIHLADLRETPAVPKDDHSRDNIDTHNNQSQSSTVHSIDDKEYGLTYPSALEDDTNISGFSIPGT